MYDFNITLFNDASGHSIADRDKCQLLAEISAVDGLLSRILEKMK